MKCCGRSLRGPSGSLSLGITATDQIVSNASNALIVLLVAGVSTSADFGLFAIAWSVANFIVAVYRSAFAVQLSMAAHTPAQLGKDTSSSVTAVALSAPVPIAVIILGGYLAIGESSSIVLILALVAPFVLVQDTLRFSAIAFGRTLLTLLSDSLWLAASLTGILWRILGQPKPADIVLLWALGALVAMAVLVIGLRPSLELSGLSNWLRETLQGRLHLSLGALALGASLPVGSIAIGAFAGSDVLATLAGGAQLMAPVNTAAALFSIGLLPRAAKISNQRRVQLFSIAGLSVAAGALIWAATLLSLPETLGQALLGQTWESTRSILVALGPQYSIGTMALAGILLLTSLQLTRAVLITSVASAVARVGLYSVVAAMVGTALSISVAETLLLLVGAVAVWLIARRSLATLPRMARDR